MLDLRCCCEGNFLGINLTLTKKMHCLVIGPKYDINVSMLLLSGMPLLWANQFKYLVIYVLGGGIHFKVDASIMRRNFFAPVNGILSKYPRASDITKRFLCETHCLPAFTYAVESLHLVSS